jgi:phage tail sheath gpL-like
MSTPNVAAAAAAAAVRARDFNTPKPSQTLCFDVVAKCLTHHLRLRIKYEFYFCL